jgi:hypothetical protein
MSEPDGVSDQVRGHLAQAPVVAVDGGGHVVGDPGDKLDVAWAPRSVR